MAFKFSLSAPVAGSVAPLASEPLEDPEDYQYLAMQACGILAELGCTFSIGGFGCDDWRFDVDYDMSTMVEQIPEFIDGLVAGDIVEIDFYSQGVERSIVGELAGDEYIFRCHSRTSWRPSPEVERVDVEEMRYMVKDFTKKIAHYLSAANSEIADIEPFRSWGSGAWRRSRGASGGRI